MKYPYHVPDDHTTEEPHPATFLYKSQYKPFSDTDRYYAQEQARHKKRRAHDQTLAHRFGAVFVSILFGYGLGSAGMLAFGLTVSLCAGIFLASLGVGVLLYILLRKKL